MIRGIMRWTVIIAADAARTARFYEQVFGWSVWWDESLDFDTRFHPIALPIAKPEALARLIVMGAGDEALWLDDHNLPQLALMEYVEDDIGDRGNKDRDHLCRGDVVLMIQSDDPDAIFDFAMQNGARCSSKPSDWTVEHPEGIGKIGFRTASFFDPEGVYVEVSKKRFTP